MKASYFDISLRRCFLFALIMVCLLSTRSLAQPVEWAKNLIQKTFNDTTTSGDSKFLAYPVIAYTPETSWEIGASALLLYHANKDVKNRLSEIGAFAFYTLENQYGLWMDHALYTDNDDYFFLGRIRLQQFPLEYHGIGIDTPAKPVAVIDGGLISIRERLLRKIRTNLYAGLQLDINHLAGVEIRDVSIPNFQAPVGTNGSTNYGMGLGLVYDERYNVLNAREGVFAEGGFLHYSESLGSTFSFNNFFVDLRYYHTTREDQVLAFQYFTNIVSPFNGSEVPFHQLALMGGENIMRGYYFGRYRDNALMAAQTEYRFLPLPFSKRFGATIFGSVGGVAPSLGGLTPDVLRFAGGVGLRFLIFPSKDIYTRLDMAVTREGTGFYLFVGEAF